MLTIKKITFGNVSSKDRSCTVYFTVSEIIVGDMVAHAIVNGADSVIFPTENNPKEYSQSIGGLRNGSNTIQIKLDYLSAVAQSETITVEIEGQEPSVKPPRKETPPVITTEDVTGYRRVPCKISYSIDSEDAIIAHFLSQDEGNTWDEIHPKIEGKGRYSITLEYREAGNFTLYFKAMDDYWDTSAVATAKVNIVVEAGEEPGLIFSETELFPLVISTKDEPEYEQPRYIYMVKVDGYSDGAMAQSVLDKIIEKGYKEAFIEEEEI